MSSWKTNAPPKESSSTELVRQDSRTTVKTTMAETETTSTSVQNDTVVNNNTVAYNTITETVTHQQQARITEITKRYTPTPEELEELLRAANFTTTETTNTSSSTPPDSMFGATAQKIPPPKGERKSKNSRLSSSPLIFTYDDGDSPRAYSTPPTRTTTKTTSTAVPTTPTTIAKIQTSDVTQKDGRTVTSQLEQQRIKIDAIPFNLSTPNLATDSAQ